MSETRRDFRVRLFAEGVLIVFSILGALWVDGLREQREKNERRDQALTHIRAELTRNLESIRRVEAYHDSILANAREVLADPDELAGLPMMAVAGRVAPTGLRPPDLRSTAWEAAIAAQAVALFDFETASVISAAYGWQEIGVGMTIQRISDRLFTADSFDQGRTVQQAMLLQALLGEMREQERSLKGQYERVIEVLDGVLGPPGEETLMDPSG